MQVLINGFFRLPYARMFCMLCAPVFVGEGLVLAMRLKLGAWEMGLWCGERVVGGWMDGCYESTRSDLGFVPLDGFCPKQTT